MQPTLAPIPLDANKYTRGSLLLLAGSVRYFGAGVLATLAAEKTGAGYVSLATPAAAAAAARQHLLCSPVIEGPERKATGSFRATALPSILQEAHHIDALCCGPGLTVDSDTIAFVGEVLDFAAAHDIPLLLDADALNALAAQPELTDERRGLVRSVQGSGGVPTALAPRLSPLILTPHTGELARLRGSSSGLASNQTVLEAATALAQELGALVVAKGPTTFITDGSSHVESSEGTPALAKAGTGDVLAGIISSLLAQGVPASDAALLGVRIHSQAGVGAERAVGRRSVTALDVIRAIPAALTAFESA